MLSREQTELSFTNILLYSILAPELMKDPSYFTQDGTYNITRAELDVSSPLYQRLMNGGNYEMNVVLENDLPCYGIECLVETVRTVKVGSIYYEYIQPPCVQLAFFNNGKQIQAPDNWRQGQMCANPALSQARPSAALINLCNDDVLSIFYCTHV